MFYKFNNETQEWYFGNEVHFPDGTKLNAETSKKKTAGNGTMSRRRNLLTGKT
jgi:hypothetical protein